MLDEPVLERLEINYNFFLTLLEAASGMHPEWQGGAFEAPPIKTSLEAILTQFFYITFIGGQK